MYTFRIIYENAAKYRKNVAVFELFIIVFSGL